MANKTINIYKKVSGSLLYHPGDTTLLYSEGSTSVADHVTGTFMDSRQLLSRKYATVVWTYDGGADHYAYVNIQGGYTEFPAQARSYSYRACFEVSRSDLNTLSTDEGRHICYGALFGKMPQMRQHERQERAETEALVEVADGAASMYEAEAQALADHIIDAIVQQKRLFVALDLTGRTDLHDNGLRQSMEYDIMVSALELLPAGLARYATFALCVDDQHQNILKDVFLVIYVKGCYSHVPDDALSLDWAQVIKPLSNALLKHDVPKTYNVASTLPGAKDGEKLLDFKTMAARVAQISKNYDAIQKKDPLKGQLKGPEWSIWQLEHSLDEVQCSDWSMLKTCVAGAPQDVHAQLLAQHKKAAAAWKLSTAMRDLLPEMQFDAKTTERWRVAVLQYYLSDPHGPEFQFLFEGIDFDFPRYLDANFVTRLVPAPQKDKKGNSVAPKLMAARAFYDRWVEIFESREALTPQTRQAFAAKYCALPFKNLRQIVDMLLKLNNLSEEFDEKPLKDKAASFVYDKVEELPEFADSYLKKLTKGQRAWVEKCIDKAYAQYKTSRLTSIDAFLDVTRQSADSARSCRLFLLFTTDEIAALLDASWQRNAKDFVANCEKMLSCGKTVRKVFKLKDPSDNVCYDAVLASLVGKCAGPDKKKVAVTPDVTDYAKWAAINELLYISKGGVRYPLTWYLLHSIFVAELETIDNSKQLAKLFNQICGCSEEGDGAANAKHRPYAEAVLMQIKSFKYTNPDEINNMEEKYKKIFSNLDDEAMKAVSQAEDNGAVNVESKFGATADYIFTEYRWWAVGIIAILGICIGLSIGFFAHRNIDGGKSQPVEAIADTLNAKKNDTLDNSIKTDTLNTASSAGENSPAQSTNQ